MFGFLRPITWTALGFSQFTKAAYLKASKGFDKSVTEKDLSGRHIMITGANSGLGLATAHALARLKATVHMVCRSPERGEKARAEVAAASGNADVHLHICDLSSLESVRALCDGFSGAPLHALVNNAGVMVHERQSSADGLEMNFATNTMGTYALTELMMPSLKAGGPGSRVVVVSSGGMLSEGLEVEDLEYNNHKKFDATKQYALDKRRQVALAERWAEERAGDGVEVYSMHPGWAATEGVRTSLPGFYERFNSSLRSPEEGADTIVWLVCESPARLNPGALEDVDRLVVRLRSMAGLE